MKVIVTGTVGLDKTPYLEQVRQITHDHQRGLEIAHVGQAMYAEAPDVARGRILDLPLARLTAIRRSVFKDVIAQTQSCENLIVNTHATFRWRHGLFPAFDFEQLAQIDADMYVCLIDNIDALHARLERDHEVDHSLKDLLVWREEETLATELMMRGCSLPRGEKPAHFYLLAMGHRATTAEMFYRLMFEPRRAKAYLSFPMTHMADLPEVLEQIGAFRHSLSDHFIIFDPADLEEQQLYAAALEASRQGHRFIEHEVFDQVLRFDVAEVLVVGSDFHAQIYARDFMLIDQADMIISYIPQLPDGRPGLSSGVERELQHAHEAAKEVYVIWTPAMDPSPFITETATQIFDSTQAALDYFSRHGYIDTETSESQQQTLF